MGSTLSLGFLELKGGLVSYDVGEGWQGVADITQMDFTCQGTGYEK